MKHRRRMHRYTVVIELIAGYIVAALILVGALAIPVYVIGAWILFFLFEDYW